MAIYNPLSSHSAAHSHDPRFRHLNLSKGERVLREVRRHPIGVLQIYVAAIAVIAAVLVAMGFLLAASRSERLQQDLTFQTSAIPPPLLYIVAGFIIIVVVIISFIAIQVYNGNRLYLTNESVIQQIQASLFSTKEQQISLGNIEDISYEQTGILQHLLNYGTLRLSTEGEETTYFFHYATNPKEQAGHIIEAHEDFSRVHSDPHN